MVCVEMKEEKKDDRSKVCDFKDEMVTIERKMVVAEKNSAHIG